MEPFLLRAGDRREIVVSGGVLHTITVSRLADHDHEHVPLYHPLNGSEDQDDLVVTVQSAAGALSPEYPPVYAACVDGRWDVYRGSLAFLFERRVGPSGTTIACTVRSI